MGATKDAFVNSSGVAIRFSIAIEGVPYLITDHDDLTAVENAYASTQLSSSTAIGGLGSVKFNGSNAIKPWDTALSITSASFAVQDADGNDVIGIMVARSAGGDETRLDAALNCVDTTIEVKSAATFSDPTEIHIGPEMCQSTSTAGDIITVTRGVFAPFVSDSGDWARAHTIPPTDYGVPLLPIVSSVQRSWIGRWVAIYAHRLVGDTLDGVNSGDAQLVFSGRLTEVRDDAEGLTYFSADDTRQALRDCVLLRDQFVATMADGMYFAAGMFIGLSDHIAGSTDTVTNPLQVVASGASGANQLNAGVYTVDQWIDAVNTWLAAEKVAARLLHRVTFGRIETADGVRTRIRFSHTTTASQSAFISLTPLVAQFMGFANDDHLGSYSWFAASNDVLSPEAPFIRFPNSGYVYFNNAKGTWFSNDNFLPPDCPIPGVTIGGAGVVQLSSGEIMFVASDETSRLQELATPPPQILLDMLGQPASASGFAARYGESEGEISIKQIAILYGPLDEIIMGLCASTGTAGYNQSTYDVFPAQLGAAIPYFPLLENLAADLTSLASGAALTTIILEKPIKLTECVASDLLLRASWWTVRDGKLRVASWATPTASTALWSLTESNKAAPATHVENHRTVASETADFTRNVVKIEFNRSLDGTAETYRDSITIVDTSSMEAIGQKPITILARNTFGSTAVIESLASNLAGWLPMFSQGLRLLRRSIDLSLYEGVAPGDQILLTDLHVRDSETGARGVTSKPGIIISHSRDFGGWEIESKSTRPMSGTVDIVVYPRDRVSIYSPAAEVDHSYTNGGYTAADKSLLCLNNEHSESTQSSDAASFQAGDEVRIIERDPASAAAPLTWLREVSSIGSLAGQLKVILTTTLSSPTWDSSKYYRIVSTGFSSAEATQKTDVYQADDADGMIENVENAFEYGYNAGTAVTWSDDDWIGNRVELFTTLCYGDGKPLDTGYEKAITRLLNNFQSVRSAPCAPHLATGVMNAGAGGGLITKILAIRPMMLFPGDLVTGERYLYVAPWYRSSSGSSTLSISLCKHPPIGTSLIKTSTTLPEYVLVGPYESHSWTTSSATWQLGALSHYSFKNAQASGLCYLVVEGTPNLETQGEAVTRAGPFVE